jgi:SAM-dependent methyltransferase
MTWTQKNSYDRSALAAFPPSWPNEMLVKVLSSLHYSPIVGVLPNDAKALEVGIFSGNNARFLIESGYQVSGSELNSEMIELCKDNLTRLNYRIPKLSIGNNTNLGVNDAEFDLLISINTIHYSSGENSLKAMMEFFRVLKPDGYAVIETPGQEHFAVKESNRKGELDWEWKAGGFRDGEEFGFFDSMEHFKSKLLEVFCEVQICRRLESYPDVTLEFWLAICKK